MSSLASNPPETSRLGSRWFFRFDGDWSLSDWLVGITSVALALGSASFFTVSYVISVRSPDFFQNAMLANLPPKLDNMRTGTVDTGDAIPAQAIVRDREPVPGDYQIVMVFQDEALLATRQELVRVKVGSTVPGLGTILSIDANALGGTVKADKATLQSAAPAQP